MALGFSPWYELVVIGATAANISTLLFFPVLSNFTGVIFNETIKKWLVMVGILGTLLVLWCVSVWLAGPRSNYIRKVLFYFFPCRILGRVWSWSWLSCPSLSAFFVWNSKGKMNCRVRWAVFEYSSPVMIPLLFFFPLVFFPSPSPPPFFPLCFILFLALTLKVWHNLSFIWRCVTLLDQFLKCFNMNSKI